MRIVFMGTADFAVPSLRALVSAGHAVALVVCQPDRPKGRGHEVQAPPLKQAALELGLEVFQPLKVKEDAAVEKIQAAGADLLVVVAYGQILPKAVLDAPRLMPLNVHASLLPKFRGAAPIEWAVATGASETGVCVQRMVLQLDAGDVLSRATLKIGPADTAEALHPRLAALGAELLVSSIQKIGSGQFSLQAQDAALATYAPLLKKSHGAADFTLPAGRVLDHFRAFASRPGFYSDLKGQTLKLLGMTGPGPSHLSDPGTLLAAGADGFQVACGDGQSVIISRIQAPGGKAMPPADYARGHGLAPGLRFEKPSFI